MATPARLIDLPEGISASLSRLRMVGDIVRCAARDDRGERKLEGNARGGSRAWL
jgi:hypothetical protein